MEPLRKVLYHDGKYFYWRSGDLNTNFGLIKKEELETAEGPIKTHTGKELIALKPSYMDLIKKIKREPQTLMPKDLAIITFYTGIDDKYKIVDAGAGCGLLASTMGRIAKEVTSYEQNEHYKAIAEENVKYLGVKNVKIKHQDIYEGIDEKNLDLITLDLPEPWRVLKHAEKALKQSGYLVTYLPTIIQVSQLVEESKNHNFLHVKTIETLEREWHVDGKKVRPKSQMIGHTAFLTFIRRTL